MASWMRPSKQRAVKKMVMTIFMGCWGLLMLNSVWHRYRPVAHMTSAVDSRETIPLFHKVDEEPPNHPLQNHPPQNISKDNSNKQENDYQSIINQRLQKYQTVCKNKWTNNFHGGKMSLVFYDEPIKLGYCFVAKIGCTFWFRLLSFLTRRQEMEDLGISDPLDIDRSALHTGKLGPAKWQYIQDFYKVVKPTTLKFLFTRNPYERLWSVYLDKYYLIDYWVTNPIANTQCGKEVTFQMFLDWAVTSSDHHLVPVNDACEPCALKPDFIGKMETFSQDTNYVLSKTGYEHLIKQYSRSRYVESEIQSLVVYNFKAMRYPIFAVDKCLTPKEMCERLWVVFQTNGFIKKSLQFPENLLDYSENAAVDMFLETVRTNPISKEESRQQRRQALVEAYSKISWGTIEAVQKRYKLDFEMFEYNTNPPQHE